ncbi:hypothetical protein SOVF_157610, partial [Spinacia oleracea]
CDVIGVALLSLPHPRPCLVLSSYLFVGRCRRRRQPHRIINCSLSQPPPLFLVVVVGVIEDDMLFLLVLPLFSLLSPASFLLPVRRSSVAAARPQLLLCG